MGYWISKEYVFLDDLWYIGEGKEAKVYRYFHEAVKIYRHEKLKNRLTMEEVSRLSVIPTRYILLPKRIVKNDDYDFCGYTTLYKKNHFKENPQEFLWNFSIKDFFDSISNLRKELNILGNYSVLISDVILQNIVFNYNKMYMVDPGNFLFTCIPLPEIDELNLFELQMGIKRIIGKLSKVCNKDKRFFILNQMCSTNSLYHGQFIVKYLKEEIQKEYGSMEHFEEEFKPKLKIKSFK